MERVKKLFQMLKDGISDFKKRYFDFRYKGIIGIVLIFALISTILFIERSGIQYNYGKRQIDYMPDEHVVSKTEANKNLEKSTLVLYNSSNPASVTIFEQFKLIFSDIKVGYDVIDCASGEQYDFYNYDKAVILLSDLSVMKENILALGDWVKGGGSALFGMTIEKEVYVSVLENKLGIIDSSYGNALVDSIYVNDGFMIGGGRGFDITDGYDSAWGVQLDQSRAKVHAYTNDERKLPLIWETPYGEGKFVVNNFGLYEKVMRGFYVASYSLLSDVCVYPVINGSVFYLDDFPSQIPSGSNFYVNRDYHTNNRDFYVNIWWPDMMNFADRYGLKYTGLAIECYDDSVDGSTDSLPDKGTFLNFGNMLLRQGGEIGYHGYNHQPLCLGNVDYKGYFDYKTWESYDAMKSAFDNLVDLCDELFPGVDISLYVPPSNVLSKEGRAFLQKEYPWIKTISGIYFEDAEVDVSCVQEYDVSENGFVDQPRVVSGCNLDNFMKLAVISELNFHFINNHFTHPDDALDPDRGAELGWEKLKAFFDEYLNWVYSSAPMIRNLTGSEFSAAVQRWAAVVSRTEIDDEKITVHIDNFYDEAQLMIRFNRGIPGNVEGGSLSHLTGNLYLLEATEDTVTISLKQE